LLPAAERSKAEEYARWLAIAAAVAILFSIAAKEILLGAALLALIISRRPWRMPPGMTLPLLLFIAGTLLALVLSPDPRAGLPQVKKFYAYLIVPVLFTALRHAGDGLLVMKLCVAAGTLSSLWSFVQFGKRWIEASNLQMSFYLHYIAQRTTGFMSHWQTFGGQLGILVLALLAYVLFARPAGRDRRMAGLAMAVLTLALALNLTRSIYIATALGAAYLLLAGRPKALLMALPLAALVTAAVPPVRQRVFSLVRPQGQIDSNEHRLVTWRTGVNMIRANPWKGVGPDRVDEEFARYQPREVTKLPEGWYGHLHNIYLQYAADRGIPVLTCFLWFLAAPLVALARLGRKTALVHGAMAAWIGVIVGGFFEANLANSEVLHLYLVTIVCGYSASFESPDQLVDPA
jgi:O-antigen ligase